MLELIGRKGRKEVPAEPGLTLLECARKHRVDWGFNCTRGTCARCRTYIGEGGACLEAPTDAERARLEPEELAEGFRLACQARIVREGRVTAENKPYFPW